MKRYNYADRLATGSIAARRDPGLPDPAQHRVRGLRHAHRAVHRQASGGRNDPGSVPGPGLHPDHRGHGQDEPALAPTSPETGALEREVPPLCWASGSRMAHLPFGHGRHLRGALHPHRGRSHRGHGSVPDLPAQAHPELGATWWRLLLEAVRISVMVLFLVAGANVFSYFLALSTIPMQVAGWAAGLEVSPYLIHTRDHPHLSVPGLLPGRHLHDGLDHAGDLPGDQLALHSIPSGSGSSRC